MSPSFFPRFGQCPACARRTGIVLAVLVALSVVVGAENPPHPLVAVADTYVSEDSGRWTIGSGQVALIVSLDSTGALQVESIGQPDSGLVWNAAASADSSFLLQSRRVSPGQSGFVLRQSRADSYGEGVRLQLTFEDTTTHLHVTRSYAAFPGSPGIETWSTFEADAAAPNVPVSDIGLWQFTVRATDVSWVTGLMSSAADGGRFTRRRQAITPQFRLDLGATGRSSSAAIPAISLAGSDGRLLAGLLWSGAWGLSVEPTASGLTAVRMSLGSIATTVRLGEPFETPHAFLGVSGAGDLDLSAAWQAYIRNGVRHGRSIEPLVTYNTWFAYGTRVDEETLRAEMDRAAQVGVELFVLDAGWYPGGSDPSDFTTGLGTWTVDARRFPSGLRALRDYAHSLGLKFGIWVEPERVDTVTVNRPGLAKERFLATSSGRYNLGVRNESASAAQVCLGDAEARQWVFDELVRFLDPLQPDYLKWDNNYWINCDRSGHGHGEKDGNYFQVQGLYGILAGLRQRYPDMTIENCGSGGNRLDFGMLRYSDTAWMDDVSGPSAWVRHNIEGLNAMFPPAYLLSFVMDDPAEPIHGSPDLEAIIRSREPAVLGFSLRFGEFDASALTTMRREVFSYKRARPVMRDATPVLLGAQVDAGGSSAADSLQLVSSRTGDIAAYLFAGQGRNIDSMAWPLLVDPDAVYELGGPRSRVQMNGAELMASGFEAPRGVSSARIVVLSKQH